MSVRSKGRIRIVRGLAVGGAIAAGALFGLSDPASAATTATFAHGTLTVHGDNLDNNITISRDAAGRLLVNGGAVAVLGGTPTVANTALIQVFGQGGNDTITLNEASGALPRANLFGGAGNDVLTGGAGDDQLFGQNGNDTLLGKGGFDFLFGGGAHDTLTGGDADDNMFGESGNDRMIWNPGDDNDINEGSGGNDTVEVNGGGGAEVFATTANGTRVRFDRLDPAPFAIDVGTSEALVLNANGGDDRFSASGDLAALIKVTVDAGTGNDNVIGTDGVDLLLGGDGDDFVDGQQGNDVAFLGVGTDTFQWDPGDGNDTIEGQDGFDTMLVSGAGVDEEIDISANGGRVRFFRNIANVLMDLNDVEGIDFNALGGSDEVSVDDLTGTDVVEVNANLAGPGGVGDAQADTVVVAGTNDDDVAIVVGDAAGTSVLGLAAQVNITGAESANDRVTVNALDGDDVVEGSGLALGAIQLKADGGNGDDVLVGGDGNDELLGGAGDDVLVGGPGVDILDGGPGDNTVIQLVAFGIATREADIVTAARAADDAWLARHVSVVDGKTVIDVAGKQVLVNGTLDTT